MDLAKLNNSIQNSQYSIATIRRKIHYNSHCNKDFANYVSRAFSYNTEIIAVIDFLNLISAVKSRKCIISSSSDWYEISMSDSFVPKYKDAKNPDDATAEIFILGKYYYANATSEDKQKAVHIVNNPLSILQITTAYDTTSNSRLIADGFKRSLGLLDKINNGEQFRPVSVLECYGSSIAQMFSSEFAHIVKK
jgi:hypothetical protein